MDKKAVNDNQKKVYEVRGGVAGLVLGLLFVFGGLIFSIFFIVKKKREDAKEDADYDEGG